MVIPITNDIRIDGSDGQNWTLQQRQVRGQDARVPGEEFWKDSGHYPNLELACKATLNKRLVLGQQEADVGMVIEAIEAFTDTVRQAIERAAPLTGRVLDPVRPPPKRIPPVPPKPGRGRGR